MAILGFIPQIAFGAFFITPGIILPFYLFFDLGDAVEIRFEIPPVVLTPEEYLEQEADRIVTICGYSTGTYCKEKNLADQLSIIINNESGWGTSKKDYAICNGTYGCGSGQGLIQLIVSTKDHCSETLEREIKRDDPFDSIDCGIYLLEEEGIHHWEEWSGPY